MSKREEIRLGKLRWININDITEKDVKYLERTFKFHHLDLEDCLSENQRAKIDEYPDYLFIILHFPKVTRKSKRIGLSEVDIFVAENLLITVHNGNSTLNKLFQTCKKKKLIKENFMGSGSGYLLYKVINEMFDAGFPLIDDLSKAINSIERDVFETDLQRDNLEDILLLKKDIINFRRIIIPQRAVVAQLEHKNSKFLPDNLEIYFDDVVDKIEKIWGVLENLKELIESLHETNETIISHNTNNVIKVLTLFSVIMMPLTVITGFYGMNLRLPFENQFNAVWIVAGIMFFVAVTMLAYFKYKRWI